MGRVILTFLFVFSTSAAGERLCPSLAKLMSRDYELAELGRVATLLDTNTRHKTARAFHPHIQNWGEHTRNGISYLVPDSTTYGVPSWKWDLIFGGRLAHAVDRDALARGATLAAFENQRPDGLVPHMNFPLEDSNSILWQNPGSSTITQPPLTLLIGDMVDTGFARDLYPAAVAEAEWWLKERMKDGLPYTIHPWEDGRDGSDDKESQMAAYLGLSPANLRLETHNPGFKDESMKRARFVLLERMQETSPSLWPDLFQLQSPDMAAHLVIGLESLARLGRKLGDEKNADRYDQWAQKIRTETNRQMWSEEGQFYYSLGRRPDPAQVRRTGMNPDLFEVAEDGKIQTRLGTAFLTLAAGIPDLRQAKILHDQLRSNRFWTETPVPTTATDEPAFVGKDYWRGSAWINVNDATIDGLLLYSRKLAEAGEGTEAKRFLRTAELLARKTSRATSAGYYEYYDSEGRPNTVGFPQGPSGFTWSGLSGTLPKRIREAKEELKELGVQ